MDHAFKKVEKVRIQDINVKATELPKTTHFNIS